MQFSFPILKLCSEINYLAESNGLYSIKIEEGVFVMQILLRIFN